MMLLAMMGLHGGIRILLVLGAYFLFKQPQWKRYTLYFSQQQVCFFASGGLEPIWYRFKSLYFDDYKH